MARECPHCGKEVVTLGTLERKLLDILRASSSPLTPSQLVERLDHGRGAIYRALENLKEKGLATFQNGNPFGVRRQAYWRAVRTEPA